MPRSQAGDPRLKSDLSVSTARMRHLRSVCCISSRTRSRVQAWDAGHEQVVIGGVLVTDRRDHSEGNCLFIERPAGGGPADAPTFTRTRTAGDHRGAFTRAAGKEPQNLSRHVRLERCVLLGSPFLIALAPDGPHLKVGQALGLCVRERVGFDQDTLPLVSFGGPAESDDDGAQPARLLGAPGQRHVSCGQVDG